MDKLELDDRVSRLERRQSFLTAMNLAFLGLVAIAALLMLRSTSDVAVSPPMATPMIPVEPTAPEPVVRIPSPDTVDHLITQLRGFSELEKKSVLSPIEFNAKKSQLLARPIRSVDAIAELAQLAELQTKNILGPIEFQEIKTKILAAGK